MAGNPLGADFDASPNNLEAFWMPFTANRQFKSKPRLLVAAKDMHYTSHDGRQILDGTAGLWCVNAGHGRKKITEAAQTDRLLSRRVGIPACVSFAMISWTCASLRVSIMASTSARFTGRS